MNLSPNFCINNSVKNVGRNFIARECVCCGSENIRSAPAVLMPFIADRIFGWAPTHISDDWNLKTIKEGNAYTICKSLYCTDCEFLFLDIRFSDRDMEILYTNYRGEEYTMLREYYEPGYTLKNSNLNDGIMYMREIEELLNPYLMENFSILDWGGDTGKNTPFKSRATKLDIFDISNKSKMETANTVNKNIAFETKYDLIVCMNVIEHVPYPADLLFDIKMAMDKSSILYLELPLEDIVREGVKNPHLIKKHWHEHINFFSEKSLKTLIEGVGIGIIKQQILKIKTSGSSQHIFQLVCKIKP